jgi:tetratricopeptide (TPR) repeat protein
MQVLTARALSRASVAIALVCAAAAPARADTGIIALSATELDRGAVARAMAAALDPTEPRIVEDAVAEARSAIAAGAVAVSRLEQFRRVRVQIDEGWRAFVRVQVELAASRLAVARTHAEELVALPGGDALYADASLRLGAVLAHLGRTPEANAALALALALDPDRPVTLAEFSPDVVAAVDAARAQPRTQRSLRITSEPAGAAITLDGKQVGRTPLTVDVTHGQHVVVANQPLFEPYARAFAVDPTTSELAVELRRDAAWTQLAQGATVGLADAQAQQLVDAAIQFTDLDQVVLVAETDRRGGPTLLVQRCAGMPARCTAVVDIGHADASGLPAAAREAWQTVRAADLRYPPSVFAGARAARTGSDDRCKLCRSPLVWGSVGAAAVIGTLVVIAVTSGSRPPPTLMVDPRQY